LASDSRLSAIYEGKRLAGPEDFAKDSKVSDPTCEKRAFVGAVLEILAIDLKSLSMFDD
jgi:hypothetical protein